MAKKKCECAKRLAAVEAELAEIKGLLAITGAALASVHPGKSTAAR